MTGKTISEKILSDRSGQDVRRGDIAICHVDCAMGTDGSAPMAVRYFAQMGGTRVFDPGRIVLFLDHYSSSLHPATAALHDEMRAFASQHGVAIHEIGAGISHQLMVESGRMRPGTLVVGADSHSVTGGTLNAFATGIGSSDLAGLLLGIVPQNPFGAAARMDLLPLVIASVIFGAAAGRITPERRRVMVSFFEGLSEICMVIIRWVMRLAPYAVFALIGVTVSRFGTDVLHHLLFYCLVVVAGLLIHVLVVLSLSLRLLARMKVSDFYRGVAKALMVAFSTASSNATLPVSIDAAERNLGISPGVAGFVLPLGATLNLNGGAIYKSLTAVFVAQVYGIPLGLPACLTIVVAATLAALAGVGVPGSSLVTTLIVLNTLGLGSRAVSGIALVLGVDPFLDMLRTTVNVTGSLTCAAYIGRIEREEKNRGTVSPTAEPRNQTVFPGVGSATADRNAEP